MVVLRAMLLSAVLVVAGCGGDGDAAALQDDVRSAWHEAARAVADGEATAFCELVTDEGKQLIERRTRLACEDGVRLLASQLSAGEKAAIRAAEITGVEVDGETATVTYDPIPALDDVGFTGRTTMREVDGRWLLSGL